MKTRNLLILIILGISACSTTIDTKIGIPPRPELIPIEQELLDQIDDHTENLLRWRI